MSLALQGDSLYAAVWADAGEPPYDIQILRVNVNGGPLETIASGFGRVPNLSADDSVLVWADNWFATVQRMTLDGGPVETIATDYGFTQSVVAASGHTFWVDGDPDAGIWDVPHGTDSLSELSSGQGGIIAADDADVFWAGDGIWGIGLDGGVAVQLSADPPPPLAMAIDDANVYVVNGSVLAATPKAGGSFTNLAELSGVLPLYLVTDDAYLYYAGAGSIGKVPKDGGAAISVVSVYVAVGGLAVDATSLYFSDKITNHIWKITPK